MRYLFHISIVFALLFSACEDKEEAKYVIVFDPATEHDFGKVEVSQSASKKIRIKNSEESPGPFTGNLTIVDSPAFLMDFSGVLVLQKNESKDIYLTFIPSAAENYSAKLVLQNDKSLNEFYLEGSGANPVSFSISPVSLDFGLVAEGNSKELELSFNNNGSSGFELELSLDLPAGDFVIPGGETNFSIAPDAIKTITVRYTPTLDISSKELQVSHNSSVRANPAKVSIVGIKDISADLVSNNLEGWNLFKNKDYPASVLKFLDTINKSRVNAVYDSISDEALLGQGWSRLFERRTNSYASSAFSDFLNAFDGGHLSENSDTDALAGIAVSGVLIASASTDQYNAVVTAANLVLNNTQGYEFQYNTNVDHKDIRYALIQAYFNLSSFTEAAKQLDILVPANAPHSSTPEDLLAAIQALAGQL